MERASIILHNFLTRLTDKKNYSRRVFVCGEIESNDKFFYFIFRSISSSWALFNNISSLLLYLSLCLNEIKSSFLGSSVLFHHEMYNENVSDDDIGGCLSMIKIWQHRMRDKKLLMLCTFSIWWIRANGNTVNAKVVINYGANSNDVHDVASQMNYLLQFQLICNKFVLDLWSLLKVDTSIVSKSLKNFTIFIHCVN